jgi:hypothetical protein
MHVMSQKLAPYTLTMWNEHGQVMLSINTMTTSFYDTGVRLAAKAQMAAFKRAGHEPPSVCALDAPIRDSPGVRAAWNDWFARRNGLELLQFEVDNIEMVTTESTMPKMEALCGRLKQLGLDSGHLGFDIEFYAPMQKNVHNYPISVITVCTSSAARVQLCGIFQLEPPQQWTAKCDAKTGDITTGVLPQCLADLLSSCKLVGNNIKSDGTLLAKYYPGMQGLDLADLGDLAQQKLHKKKWSLEALVRHPKVLGQHLDKSIATDQTLPNASKRQTGATSAWHRPLSHDQLRYAANDGYASAEVYFKLSGLDASASVPDDNDAGNDDTSTGSVDLEESPHADMLAIASKLLKQFNGMLPLTADEDNGEENEDNEENEENQAASEFAEWPVNDAIKYLIESLAKEYASSAQVEPLIFPAFLSSEQRSQVHTFAEAHVGIASKTIDGTLGVYHGKCVVLSKCNGAAGPEDIAGIQEPKTREQFPVDPNWHKNPFKGDGRHWLALWLSMGTVQMGAIFTFFLNLSSQGMFVECPERRKAVEDHLVALGKTRESLKFVPRRYFRRMGKFTSPCPEDIIFNMAQVYELMKRIKDPETGTPFLKYNHATIYKNCMRYLQAGYHSPPPGLDVYGVIGHYKTGLEKLRCLSRSTSPGEGYHVHAGGVAKSPGEKALTLTRALTHASPSLCMQGGWTSISRSAALGL